MIRLCLNVRAEITFADVLEGKDAYGLGIPNVTFKFACKSVARGLCTLETRDVNKIVTRE